MNKIYDDWFINEDGKYVCECGRIFETVGSFRSHRGFCDCHEHGYNYENVLKHRKTKNFTRIDDYKKNDCYICECGKSFDNKLSISAHFGHCDIHKKINNIKTERIYTHTNHWENKTKEEIIQIAKNAAKIKKEKYENGELIYKSHPQSEETKEKLRIWMTKRIQSLGNTANYSIKACDYINKLNEKYGWSLQHAKNGGEFCIKGYFLDGYDKENNICFEYDEKRHYTDIENSILCVKDQIRQYIIMKHLGCKMFRYNEYIDYFYEVIDPKIPECKDVKDAIDKNMIDYTSRESVKKSIKQLGLSLRKYYLYVSEHPDCGDALFSNRTKNTLSQIKEKETKRLETRLKRKQGRDKRQENNILNYNIFKYIKYNIDKIDTSKWNRLAQIKQLLYPIFGDITTKKIKVSIKNNDIDLYKMIFNRENLGSYGQIWITDENGIRKRVKKE